jgi:hypothetical protein
MPDGLTGARGGCPANNKIPIKPAATSRIPKVYFTRIFNNILPISGSSGCLVYFYRSFKS